MVPQLKYPIARKLDSNNGSYDAFLSRGTLFVQRPWRKSQRASVASWLVYIFQRSDDLLLVLYIELP